MVPFESKMVLWNFWGYFLANFLKRSSILLFASKLMDVSRSPMISAKEAKNLTRTLIN